MTRRLSAAIALLLVVPASSLGVAAGMLWAPDTTVGRSVFALCKLWLLAAPALWLLLVEKARPARRKLGLGDMLFGLGTGLAMSALIAAVYLLLGDRLINARVMIEAITRVGLDTPAVYLAGAAYWVLVNSLLEEYVWRWFVFRRCEELVGPVSAVVLSALLFTLHHTLALSLYMSPAVNALASFGVFVGGATWSWCFLRFRSVWPGYLSHAAVDITVFFIAYRVVFG